MYEIIGYKLNNGYGFTMLEKSIHAETLAKVEEFERATERSLKGNVTVDAVYRVKINQQTNQTGKK